MLSVATGFGNLTSSVALGTTVELREAMLAIDAEAADVSAGLNEEQLSWCPGSGRWSIAQNLAHLRRTAEVFLPAVDSAIAATRDLKLRSEGPFRLGAYGRFLVWRMDAPPMIGWRAPKSLQPQLLRFATCELEHFLDAQAAVRRRVEEIDGFDVTALRFVSPVASYVRVNLLEFFSVFNAHARRHLRQAKNIHRALPSRGR